MVTQQKYDIFISYRRKDVGGKAEHLKDLLDVDFKNRISFDRENLTGVFDVPLIRRIDNCMDFLLVIGKNSFDYTEDDYKPENVELYRYLGSCTQQQFEDKIIELGQDKHLDFMRIEIARALNRKDLNIIPITPESDNAFSFGDLKLPQDISGIKRYEAVFYSDHHDALFKDVVPKIKKRLKSRPKNIIKTIIYTLLSVLLLLAVVFGVNYILDVQNKKKADTMRVELEKKHKNVKLYLNKDLTQGQMKAIDEILDNMKKVNDTLWAGKFEFTKGLWYGIKGQTVDESQLDLPITDVSFGEVCDFILYLIDITNIDFELPSAAIWEFLAQGGDYHENTAYSGSDDVDKVAWYDKNSDGHAHPSNGLQGKYPNKLDLYDMSGNVGELCNSSYDISKTDSPAYTICGGDFNSSENNVTIMSKKSLDVNLSNETTGFRLIIHKFN